MIRSFVLLILSTVAVSEEDFQTCPEASDAGVLLLQTPDLTVQLREVPAHQRPIRPTYQGGMIEEAVYSAIQSALDSWQKKWPQARADLDEPEGETEMYIKPSEGQLNPSVALATPPRNITVSLTLKKKPLGVVGHTFRAVLVAAVVVFLIAFAGTMSGLSLGMLQLRETDLEVLLRAEEAELREMGADLAHVLQDKHLLLVTLLLCNAVAAEILPLVLNVEMNAFAAATVGILGILIGGEILPQAIFSTASITTLSHFTPLVQVLLWVSFPIARPVATILDMMFDGVKRPFEVPRQALSALLQLQHKKGILSGQEAQILEGALALAGKKVGNCMTRLEDVRVVSEDAKADLTTMEYLRNLNRSRVPVHSADDQRKLVSIIICKSLLGVHPKDGYSIKDLAVKELLHVSEDDSMADVLAVMQGSVSRMAVVYDKSVEIPTDGVAPQAPALGIVTMNDIVEQLLMSEIKDDGQRLVRLPSLPRARSHDVVYGHGERRLTA